MEESEQPSLLAPLVQLMEEQREEPSVHGERGEAVFEQPLPERHLILRAEPVQPLPGLAELVATRRL